MTDREMLDKLTWAADELLEYTFPNRVRNFMEVTQEALKHLGREPFGWGSALAGAGWKAGAEIINKEPEQEKGN